MSTEEILEKILAQYVREYKASEKIQAINRKIEKGISRYSEAEMLAQESGEILTRALQKYLPEALTDGYLYREIAEVVLKNPILQSSRNIRAAAIGIQKSINEKAGIGMIPIEPEINMDQIDGILTGICGTQGYAAGEKVLMEQVGNFLEGYVDDFVRENADFQYQAGLEPKVIRMAAGKCCKWCENLAGTYKYADVRNRGNDVWKRHRNCHCVIEYDPGQKSRRKNTRDRSTDPDRDDRIAMAESAGKGFRHSRTYASELPNGLPINGEPDSIADKLNEAGEVIQRRKYGKNGRAAIDYDLVDHGESWKHPTGAHKHIFDYSGGKIRRKTVDMTQEDLDLNADIIKKGVNYFDK